MSKKVGLIVPHDYKLLSIAAILEVFETANKLTKETEKPSNCRATTMGEESARSREREEVSGKYPKFHSAQT